MSNWARSAWNSRARRRDNRDGWGQFHCQHLTRNRNSVAPRRSPREFCKGTSRRSCTWARRYLLLSPPSSARPGKRAREPRASRHSRWSRTTPTTTCKILKNQLQAEQQKEPAADPHTRIPTTRPAVATSAVCLDRFARRRCSSRIRKRSNSLQSSSRSSSSPRRSGS